MSSIRIMATSVRCTATCRTRWTWYWSRQESSRAESSIRSRVNRRRQVGLYGPSRPKSGAACQASVVDEQGRFRLPVAPGVNYPYIMTSEYWQRTQRREYFEKGIEVNPGEVVSVVFRILPTKPVAD